MRPPRLTLAFAVALVALVACKDERGERHSVRRVVALPGGDLLLVERNGFADSTMDRARLTRVDPNGAIRARIDLGRGGAVVTYAVTPDLVWVSTLERGLHARSTATLEPVGDAARAVRDHPVLGRGYEVAGSLGEQIILTGRDDRRYAVSARGEITTIDAGAAIAPRVPSEPIRPDQAPVATSSSIARGARLGLDRAPLVDPQLALDPTGAPITLDDPAGALVVSVDLRGRGGNHRLSRVTSTGEVAWQLKAEAVAGRSPLPGKPAYRIVAVVPGDVLVVVIEGDVQRRSGDDDPYGLHDPLLAHVDARAGDVRAVHRIGGRRAEP